jgi:tetratricopeptide (TPR) repeat protein
MSPFLWSKAITTGLLLAALTHASGSAAWRPDPYGLVTLGVVPGDGGPVERPVLSPGGDVGAALAAFHEGDPEEAVARLVRAVLTAPGDAQARLALGALLLDAQDFEGALGQLRYLDRRTPDDPEVLYLQAWAHHGLGQAAEALACAQEVVRQRPRWAPGVVRHGLLLVAAGDREGGAAELRRAAACPNAAPEVFFDVANHFLGAGRAAEAIPLFRRALALRPDYSWAANNLGNAYRATGDAEQARQAYQLAIAADPDNPNPHNGLGAVREQAGDLRGALASYRAATRVDADYMDARYNAGLVLLKLGRPKDAVVELEAARALRPDFATVWFQLAEAYFRLGELDRAKAHYRKAAAMDPAVRTLGGDVSRLLGEGGRR